MPSPAEPHFIEAINAWLKEPADERKDLTAVELGKRSSTLREAAGGDPIGRALASQKMRRWEVQGVIVVGRNPLRILDWSKSVKSDGVDEVKKRDIDKTRSSGTKVIDLPPTQFLYTLDQICYLLGITHSDVESVVKLGGTATRDTGTIDKRMTAKLRSVALNDTREWRVPESEFVRYLDHMNLDVTTKQITIREPKKRKNT